MSRLGEKPHGGKNKTKKKKKHKTKNINKRSQPQSVIQLSEYLTNTQGHIRFSLPRTALRCLLLHVQK